MMSRTFLRPTLARMPAFGGLPTADSLRGDPQEPALLHLNECPYPPSPAVVDAICRHASGLNRYAEPRPAELAGRFAERSGLLPAAIVFGNGSDEILAMIATATLEPGDSAVMPTPSFPRYRIATAVQGAIPRLVRNLNDGSNDVSGLLAAIDETTRVVFACTPNNPSGAPLPAAELERLTGGVPPEVLLVVDEAYAEFDRHEGAADSLTLLKRRRGPWISTRTFSKAYALAGLRIGYALASDAAVADALIKVKTNFNLNRLAVHAALAALDDETYAQRCIADAVAERERLAARLREFGLRPLLSRANFISFDIGRDAMPVMAAMAQQAVLVREWRDPGFESYIRISIGLPEENDRAFAALVAALSRNDPA